ncbi:MAG: type II toxin-antitoxin system HipA family toxin, partial [Methyloprofundus sp.]|nr:type II toxin-antitoxin system HipA family toxin [Methyloprofundus sp.]
QNGRNVLVFAEPFIADMSRPTFSLTTHPDFPNVDKQLAEPWARKQRLHPILSNLLPEGSLRELLAQRLKIHPDNEFQLFSYLGHDLPGALIASVMLPDEVPQHLFANYGGVKAIKIEAPNSDNKFSLAGVQMKFSMKEKEGRYQISQSGELGDWIIKTPSTQHKNVPLNEYTAMTLAQLVGINIPDIRLIELAKLDNLPPINLPKEKYAFAIRRFDRAKAQRIHMEDFAQILIKYPHEKYHSASYEQVGKIIYQYTGDGLANAQQFAQRLLVNILLANGDAHLKNWSLLYADRITAELSPAHDIVTTRVYMGDEKEYALNMGKTKQWYAVNMSHFELWSKKSGIPWRAIKPHLEHTIEKARALWPNALKDLPMDDEHKEILRKHGKRLHKDFWLELS